MTAEIVLAVDGVSKSFGALAALTDVSFDVRAGEVFSVIGPNGAGKSHALQRHRRPARADRRARPCSAARRSRACAPEAINRRGLAKTFQITNIFPGISVLRERARGRRSRACPCRAAAVALAACPTSRSAVMELLGAFGLAGRRDELAQNLSHGEQRYLEICLALATEPDAAPPRRADGGHDPGRDEGRDGAHPPDRARAAASPCC